MERQKLFLLASWRSLTNEQDPEPDPLFKGTDPRIRICIRIHTKMSWIWNTSHSSARKNLKIQTENRHCWIFLGQDSFIAKSFSCVPSSFFASLYLRMSSCPWIKFFQAGKKSQCSCYSSIPGRPSDVKQLQIYGPVVYLTKLKTK